MRLVVISDTHGLFPDLPSGDILIHAGDATMMGTEAEVREFDEWIGGLKFECKIFTPGNHDFKFADNSKLKNAITVINEPVTFKGLKIWASPYSITFGAWAFMTSETNLYRIWDKIPNDTDIVITHTPPYGILDMTVGGVNAGSRCLKNRIDEIKPKFHFFGHIHEHGGKRVVCNGTTFYNASVVNEYYKLCNKPLIIDI
jgi:Icc-related predicted phosphoesterase